MSKQVELNIIIDQDGNIIASPEGTEGTECLNLMGFLDKIEGFTVVETVKNNDFKIKKVQINSVQKIKQ
jgi:hypothetical protein